MKKILLSILILTFISNQAFADAAKTNEEKEVHNFVNDIGNKIIAVAGNSKLNLPQRKERLVTIIEAVVDIDWISKFVLGKHYRTATPEQKEQFKKLYREFMINTYSPKFTGYNGEKFSITSITKDDNYYTAKCLFSPKDKAPTINLDFRVRKNTDKNESKFLIFDIVAEGVSLIETQRSEFGSVISKDGLDSFLADLVERIKKLKSENAKPQSGKAGGSSTAKKK